MKENKIKTVSINDEVSAVSVSNRNVSDKTVKMVTRCICTIIMTITLAVLIVTAEFAKVVALLVFVGLALLFTSFVKILK